MYITYIFTCMNIYERMLAHTYTIPNIVLIL